MEKTDALYFFIIFTLFLAEMGVLFFILFSRLQ